MASYYLDTSALVKYYAREVGTPWITALINPAAGSHCYTVRLTGPEMVAALSRKARMGELSSADATNAIRAFRRTWRTRYHIVTVTAAVTERAMDLADRHGLRGYGAVHLAAALTIADAQRKHGLPTSTFLSADSAQWAAAAAEGLPVDDPNAHP